MSDPARFRRVAELFESARSMPPPDRAALLESACDGDAALAAEVRRLLAHHDSGEGFLAEPLAPPSATRVDQPIDPVLPESIGAYRIIRLLGAGGMGAVYLAEQQNPQRPVALKVIRPGAVSADALRRFQLEATILGRLRHPGIAQIYEAGAYADGAGQRPYFAMEHVDGVPLLEYAATAAMGLRARLELLARVCDALQHAHQQGVIHRDLKPANILVDPRGQPKVLDFGVACVADEHAHTLATQAGTLLGTIGYMAPEQIEGGPAAVDTRTDVHALGVLMFELLTGQPPYDLTGISMTAALRRVREDPPASPGTLNPSLRGDVETICAKALEKDKARRYPSAAALADDIRRFLHREPIAARPASTMYQLRRFAQRRWPLVTAAGALALALLVTLVATGIAAYRIARDRDRAIAAMNDATGATTFLSDVLTSLDPRERATPDVSLIDFLDDVAARIEAGQLAAQPRVEAAVRATIGSAYRELGRLEPAGRHLARALTLYEADGPRSAADVASVLSSLGALQIRTGDLDQAERTLLRSIAAFESLADQAADGIAGALHTLAHIRLEQRRVADALALLQRALDRRRSDPQPRDESLARLLSSYAGALRLAGRTAEARAAYEEALAIGRRLRAVPGLDVAQALTNLAVLHMYDENPAAARPLLEEALAIREALLPANHPDLAQSCNALGGIHALQGDWSAAAAMYREAVRIRAAARGADHFSLAAPLVNLGVAQRNLGCYEEAVTALDRAVAIRRAALGHQHVQVASPLNHLARTWIAAGDGQRAVDAAAEATLILAAAHGAGSEPVTIATSVLGRSLLLAAWFDHAEAALLEAEHDFATLDDPAPATLRAWDNNRAWIADLYAAWDTAEPGRGYAAQAEEWRDTP